MIFFIILVFKINGYILYRFKPPLNKDSIIRTIKIKKMILAIPAAVPAIPPKPKIAAMTAMTIKMIVHRNIRMFFKLILKI